MLLVWLQLLVPMTWAMVFQQPQRTQLSNLKRDKIVLIGDSITQMASQVSLNGWAANLLSTYQRKLDVINRGAGGYTTKWWMPYLAETMANAQEGNSKVVLTVVLLGSNDCNQEGKQAVALGQFKENMEKIVDIIQGVSERIMVMTPPPIDSSQKVWKSRDPTMYRSAILDLLATSNPDPRLDVLDLWPVFLGPNMERNKTEVFERFFVDGLHPNAAGNDLIYQVVLGRIWERFPEIREDRIEMVPPPYDTLE